jgi:hypothetical protein
LLVGWPIKKIFEALCKGSIVGWLADQKNFRVEKKSALWNGTFLEIQTLHSGIK